MKPGAPLNDIPRLQGRFFWSQITAAKRAGADMLYVAMFDEVDEAKVYCLLMLLLEH